jgi:hypothetical protein
MQTGGKQVQVEVECGVNRRKQTGVGPSACSPFPTARSTDRSLNLILILNLTSRHLSSSIAFVSVNPPAVSL